MKIVGVNKGGGDGDSDSNDDDKWMMNGGVRCQRDWITVNK